MIGRKRRRDAEASGGVTIIEITNENGENVPMRVSCQNGQFDVSLAELIKGTYFVKDSRSTEDEDNSIVVD